MFTGIVQEIGEIKECNKTSSGKTLEVLATNSFTENLKKISINAKTKTKKIKIYFS